jgi:hypothetical protein
MGAFHSTPHEPLHQLSAILPINIHLMKLVSQAAIHLLTLPPNSPVLHHLGQPWSSDSGSRVPLPYPSLTHPPHSCIRWLTNQVMADSHSLPTFNHPPWWRCLPPANCFSVSQESVKGAEQKNLATEVINSHCSKMDQIIIYCRSMGPNPTQSHPTWMVASVAFCQG